MTIYDIEIIFNDISYSINELAGFVNSPIPEISNAAKLSLQTLEFEIRNILDDEYQNREIGEYIE